MSFYCDPTYWTLARILALDVVRCRVLELLQLELIDRLEMFLRPSSTSMYRYHSLATNLELILIVICMV